MWAGHVSLVAPHRCAPLADPETVLTERMIAMMPTTNGYFGAFGGAYVPEVLIPALETLAKAYNEARQDPSFLQLLRQLSKSWSGRPTPVYPAERLSKRSGGARILLKREDLLHTGAHKLNNSLGQGLLAQRMGKNRIIAETGAGQHGVAVAATSTMLGQECTIYMGEEDMERQAPNVFRMELLGAEVRPVSSGTRTLKDAVNEAIRDWVSNLDSTYYVFGSVVGPHPYPLMVRDFQSVIGDEAREQVLELTGALPEYVVCCVGGGSNAIGMFQAFRDDESVHLVGVEAGGRGLDTDHHGASLSAGRVGVFHGSRSYVLQDQHGQIQPAHSISAGLDYPGVGPEHSFLKEAGRATYVTVDDSQALSAVQILSQTEGIIPALESAHALHHALKLAQASDGSPTILVNLSGRGDKDMPILTRFLETEGSR